MTSSNDHGVFQWKRVPPRYELIASGTQINITIERDRDLTKVVLQGYYLSELVSDIAGFVLFVVHCAYLIIAVWNYKDLERYLIANLYR